MGASAGETKIFTSIPYIGPLSEKIGGRLAKVGIQVAYKSKAPLRSHFTKVKDKVHVLDKSGVYRISCADCEASYVGQTGRKLRTRLKEHLTSSSSEFKKHIRENGHNPECVNYELLHCMQKGKKLTITEGIEIKLNCLEREDALNRVTDVYTPRHFTPASLPPLISEASQRSGRPVRVLRSEL